MENALAHIKQTLLDIANIGWLDSAATFWIVAGFILILGMLIGGWIKSRKNKKLKLQVLKLESLLEISKEENHDTLMDMMHHSNQETLSQHTESFIKLANENFSKHQQQASHVFDNKQQSIANLLTPIQEVLQRTTKQVNEIENTRKTDYGAISEHLKHVSTAQQAVEEETRQLVAALRRPEIRGAWGELTLKRLLELSGLNDYADFTEQVSTVTNEKQRLRPDLIIKLPENRCLVIDAKTPLDAYLDAMKTNNKEEIKHHMKRHCQNVKNQIKDLATKKYWEQFDNTPDFVILFIPNDNFLSAALDVDNNLIETAIKQNILLATPTSLVALLRTVAHGWRQYTLSDNAKELQNLGTELYQRIAVFNEHYQKLGKSLQQSVDFYNKSIGSMQKNIMPSLRKFESLGIESNETNQPPQTIETPLRTTEKND